MSNAIYFNELETKNLLDNYYNTNNDNLLDDIIKSLKPIIIGMINKCFSYNTYIKDNYDDIVQECLLNIFLVVKNKKINPKKGKIFSYVNRVIKNTILISDNKIRNYDEKNVSISKLVNGVESDDECCNDLLDCIYDEHNYFSNIKNECIIKNDLISISIIYIWINKFIDILRFVNNEEYYNIVKYDENLIEDIDFLNYTEIINDLIYVLSNVLDKFNDRSNYFNIIKDKSLDHYLLHKNYKFPNKLFRNIVKKVSKKNRISNIQLNRYTNLMMVIWRNIVEK